MNSKMAFFVLNILMLTREKRHRQKEIETGIEGNKKKRERERGVKRNGKQVRIKRKEIYQLRLKISVFVIVRAKVKLSKAVHACISIAVLELCDFVYMQGCVLVCEKESVCGCECE